MVLMPQEILRNQGKILDQETGRFERRLLIARGSRKGWVIAEGPTHAIATERVFAAADELLVTWEAHLPLPF